MSSAFIINRNEQRTNAKALSKLLDDQNSEVNSPEELPTPSLETVTINISVEEVDIYTKLIDNLINSYSEEESTRGSMSDDPLSTYCQTEECVQQLKDYMKWREENGYPTPGGRWG